MWIQILGFKRHPPPIKAFMDDIFLKANSFEEGENLLQHTNVALTWARMALKASKSKSLVIMNGKVQHDMFLSIKSPNKIETIPSIIDNAVGFLGRSISFKIIDRDQVNVFSLAVSKGLSLIDNSCHRGIHKLWILQHLLLPRLRWTLLIYEIPVTTVIRLEQKISCFIRKWLKLHNSTSNVCLYSSVSPCPLPLKSLSSVLKAAKVSGHLLLRDSTDQKVAEANINLKCGNWKVGEEVGKAEDLIEFKKILGYHQTSRAGFGSFSIPELPRKRSHEYRKLVSSFVNDSEQSNLEAKAVQLGLQ